MSETTSTTQTTESIGGTREKVALAHGRGGIVGVKAGMTQIYTKDGDSLAVTVIDIRPNVITQVKTKETDGYQAIQVGVMERKASRSPKAELGHGKKSSTTGFYYSREFRLDAKAKMDDFAAGKVLSLEFIKEGDYVDLTAMSKGKGFQGGMKRFHMAGGHKTHGASVCHRSLGSIGQRADPGKVWKNRKMPGQMGHVQSTVQNVRVIKVDQENGILLVHGSVPGPKSGLVTVRKAVKFLN